MSTLSSGAPCRTNVGVPAGGAAEDRQRWSQEPGVHPVFDGAQEAHTHRGGREHRVQAEHTRLKLSGQNRCFLMRGSSACTCGKFVNDQVNCGCQVRQM